MKKPKIFCRSIGNGVSESFDAQYSDGKIEIKAESPYAAQSALHQLNWASDADHWPDYLGKSTPKYDFRPLWIKKSLSQQPVEVADRLLELGYNTLITSDVSQSLSSALKNKGLNYYQVIEGEKVPHSDGSYLYSSRATGLSDTDKTEAELVIDELHHLEKQLSSKANLIFCVEQAPWFIDLCNAAGPRTKIAFSNLAGAEDHLPPNPVWSLLRHERLPLQTPLLPIINVGGDGRWPLIPFEQFELSFPRLQRHRFIGTISDAETLPMEVGFLECNLWTAGQLQWRSFSPEMILETWFKSRAGINHPKLVQVLREIRSIALEISYFRLLSDKKRREMHRMEKLDSLLTRMRLLKAETESIGGIIQSSYECFYNDVVSLYK